MLHKIKEAINNLCESQDQVVIAIDGRCGAGKTTLAMKLQELYDCNVIQMDHFFLRPDQRTPERLKEPGGNVDRERFLKEVIKPLKEGKMVSYQPFDCQKQALGKVIELKPNALTIVEGVYSCHPELVESYDFTIFLTVSPMEQLRRIRLRNGEEKLGLFKDKWIPLEEAYLKAYDIASRCDFEEG